MHNPLNKKERKQMNPASLVDRPANATDSGVPAAHCRRAAVLDRRSTKVMERARAAGTPIRYLGLAPLFAETRAYAGPKTDWVVGPVTDLSEAVVPRAERAALMRLLDAGIDFPMIYIAHEVQKGQLPIPVGSGPESRATTVDQAAAEAAVGPVPPSAAATALSDRLGRSSQRLLRGMAMAVPIAGAIVAAPFVLAGAAVAAIGAIALDPIVFGVIPAGRPVPGQPAAWYVLVQWDWPATLPGLPPAEG
jgi:hypothetical protein